MIAPTFDRRALIVGAATVAVLPRLARAALPVPAAGHIAFEIIRKGAKLGSHTLTFAQNGADLTVTIAVELIYKLGPITLYHYRHDNIEHWRGDRIASFAAQTNDNGTRYTVSGRRDTPGAGLSIQSSAIAPYVAPVEAMPATHWNRAELHNPWINPQDGKLLRPHVAEADGETIATGLGPCRATRYRLTGDAALDMWYDARWGWVALAFARGGAPVTYRRQS